MTLENNRIPLVTVVTIVFNGEDFIEDTILSVINQNYSNIEYIVIDGESTDKTTEIIKRYVPHIHYWVSEKDSGIYDAMNKAIDAATGEWMIFMNAGDTFSSNSSIADVFSRDQNNFAVIYGDVNVVYSKFMRLVKAKMISEIPKGMPFCHQSTLVKTSYHKTNKFNVENPIAADMEFFMSAYLSGFQFNYLPFSISNISSGGLSDTKRIETILAWWKVSVQLGSSKYLALHYMALLSTTYLKAMVKRMIPNFLVLKLLKFIR
jgi:glycosyltransferase involved in cell wall biosynthesis